MAVQYMSFSAHADAKGIMQLIRHSCPDNVMLVHGEAKKMDFLREKILKEFSISCYKPANGESVTIKVKPLVEMEMQKSLWKRLYSDMCDDDGGGRKVGGKQCKVFEGFVVAKAGSNQLELTDKDGAMERVKEKQHLIKFTSTVTISDFQPTAATTDKLVHIVKRKLSLPSGVSVVKMTDTSVSIGEVIMTVNGQIDTDTKVILVSWYDQDEDLGSNLLKILQSINKR